MSKRSGLACLTASICVTAGAILAGAAAVGAVPHPGAFVSQSTVPQQKKPVLYDERADAKGQIRQALEKAKRENRRVLLQWGANWCGWCHILHDHFQKNAEVRRKLLFEYEIVHVDVGEFDKNLDLARKYGAEFIKQGVPYLTVLDADGKVLANQDTGALELKGDAEPGHDPKKVLAFLEKHRASPQSAESVLSDGLARAGKEQKMVFLHFGAPWCTWCRKLDDWMSSRAVAPVLGKDFVDVKIDVDRMIGGKDLMKRFRGDDSGGIPWFAFLDANGKPIATSASRDGNLGCPATPEEIAAFKSMLRGAVKRMSTQDVDRITAKLAKVAKP